MTEFTSEELEGISKEIAAGVSIDPATWEDPKQTFPGVVEVSHYRYASDEYRAATQFRSAIPDPLPQWDLRVRRLDAVLLLPDGSQVAAFRYGGIDLKKWVEREHRLVLVSSRFPKEWFIASEWKRVFGQVSPPENLVGRKAIFDFYPTKGFGGSMPARNVLVPVQVLPPDYEFTGETQIIPVREKGDDGSTPATVSVAPSDEDASASGTVPASFDLVAFLTGKNRNDPATIISSLPVDLRQPGIVSGLATGSLIDALSKDGQISIADDGTITAVA